MIVIYISFDETDPQQGILFRIIRLRLADRNGDFKKRTFSWFKTSTFRYSNKRLLDGVSTDWNDDQDDAAVVDQVEVLVEAQLLVPDKRTIRPPPLRDSWDRGFD